MQVSAIHIATIDLLGSPPMEAAALSSGCRSAPRRLEQLEAVSRY